MRYRKRIKLAPGLTLNLNKKSVSLTAGTRGAHVTVNSKHQRTVSVGIPGSGLSYRDTKTIGQHPHSHNPEQHTPHVTAARGSTAGLPQRTQSRPMLHPLVLWLALLPFGFGFWAAWYAASKVPHRPSVSWCALLATLTFFAGCICLGVSNPNVKASAAADIAVTLWMTSWALSAAGWLLARKSYVTALQTTTRAS